MATARISESLWTCAKRWALEFALARAGHRFDPTGRARAPMSGAECVCRILAFLDKRTGPDGSLVGFDDGEIEFAAGWTGKPGVLLKALVETGWIDATQDGPVWHHYFAFNSLTAARRAAGSKGGDKSVEVRRERRGTAQPLRLVPEATPEANPKQPPKQTPEATGESAEATPERYGYGSEFGSGGVEPEGGSDARAGAREPPPGALRAPQPQSGSAPPAGSPVEAIVADLAPKLADAIEDDQALCTRVVRDLLLVGVPEGSLRREIAAVGGPVSAWAWKTHVLTQHRAANPAAGRGRPDHGQRPPESGAAARIAAERAAEAGSARAFDEAYAAWQAAGNTGTRGDFRRARLAAAGDSPDASTTSASAWRPRAPAQTCRPPRETPVGDGGGQ